jgi:hypothetical protein
VVVCNPPAEFGAYLKADVTRWKDVAQRAKIRLEQ